MIRTRNRFGRNILAVSAIVLLSVINSNAQTIQGTFSVTTGCPTYTYTYDAGALLTGGAWVVTNGTFVPSVYGTTYTAVVTWTTTGTTAIKFKDTHDGILDIETVSISAGTMSAPSPLMTSLMRCGPGTLTLQATQGSGGNTVRWYNSSGTYLGQGTSYTTLSESSATTFYITTYNPSGCESSPRTQISTTINSIPDAPTIVTAGSVCGSGTVTLTGSPSTGTIGWYTDNSTGTFANGSVATGQTYQPSLSSSKTYYMSSYNNGTGCETAPGSRTPITATVNLIPSAPTGSGASVCGPNSVSLSATHGGNGDNCRWYLTPGGAAQGPPATSYQTQTLSSTTPIYVSTYNSATGCESYPTYSLLVETVTVNPIPGNPTPTDGYGCGSSASVYLTGTPGSNADNLKWYSAYAHQTGGISFLQAPNYTPSVPNTTTLYISSVNTSTTCESDQVAVIANLNPFPAAPTSPTPGFVCGSGNVSLSAVAPTGSNNTLNWYLSPHSGTASNSNPFTTPVISTSTDYAVYTYNTATQCESASGLTVTASVNTIPSISPSGNNQAICSGTNAAINFNSNGVPNTTFSWTINNISNVTVTGSSNVTNSSATSISQQLNSTTGNTTGNCTYYITPYANGCYGTQIPVIVNVNPVPTLSVTNNLGTLCSGKSSTNITLSNPNGVSGTLYSWTINPSNVSGGTAASNTSSTLISQAITSTSGNTSGTIAYTVTPSATFNSLTCSGPPTATSVTVNPVPVPAGSGQTICSGTGTSIALSSNVSGTSFSWTVAQSNVSGATSSSGSSIAQTLTATTTGNGTATYTVTPTASGCIGSTIAPVATVKPKPVASGSGQSICSGATTSITLSSNVSGTTFSWTVVQSKATGASNNSGGTITQALTATTTTNGTATYTVTPTANGCNGATIAPVATVKPKPVLTVPNQTIFVGSSTNIALSSNVAGSTFSYSVSTHSNVSNAASGTSTPLVQALTVTDGLNPGSATYLATATAAGCVSSNVNFTASVYPNPLTFVNGVASSPSTTYYNNFGYGATISTKTFYYSYQWYNAPPPTTSNPNPAYSLVSGATTASYLPSLPGKYYVTVVGTSGGPSANTSSTPINISEPGVQADSVNSVSRVVFYKAGLTALTSPYLLLPSELAQSIVYSDGLGRPVQTVAVAQSPTVGDIVLPTVPGHSGLTDSTFLPYATTSIQGTFRHNAVRGGASVTSYSTSDQFLFYQQASTSKLPSDGNPYARVVFRNTPDARIVEQGAQGGAFQPGSSHTVRNQMALSTSSSYPVLQWKANGTTTGYYPNNTVWVTTITDENNHIVNVYKNKLGQTVLKQVQQNGPAWMLTYYIYDIYGQLIYQIPPQAITVLGGGTSLNANVASVADLIYTYTYDQRGRLIQKKVPGSGLSYTVYDQLDRVVLTQNALQLAQGVWMFVKYDYKNRPVYYGQIASSNSRATWQSQFDALNYSQPSPPPYFETAAANATYQGYSNSVLPTTGLTVLGAMYYDSYDFDQNGSDDYSYDNTQIPGMPSQRSASIRGLSTGSKKLIMGTSSWLSTYIFYDNLDRPIQTLSNNHLNLALNDKVSVLYFANNLSTKVQKIKSIHVGATTVTVTQRYTYDNTWRTTGIYHTINANAEQQVAAYSYNAIGQLVTKSLHNTGAAFLQNVDMRYNIRGWLTSINNAQLNTDGGATNSDTNDYFGMELFYNNAETSSLGNNAYYNGNVSAVKWKNGGGGTGAVDQRSYLFNYDNSDRLLSATFKANSGAAWNKESSTLDESMSYDKNGNIATLTRNQNQRTLTGTSSSQTIDSLTYTYASSTQQNQLQQVSDASANTAGFGDGVNSGTDYTYDSNGNLTADQNKGIDSIKYNVLGKPYRVKFHDGRLVTYIYEASGKKLKMVATVSGVTTTTDYVNGYVYSNATLSFFSSPEGRVVKNGSNYEYQYAITDHLGNTRVVFTSAAQTAQSVTAGFETANQTTEATNFTNYPSGSHINTVATNAHSGSNSLYLNGSASGQVGVTKSYQVFAGDQLSIQAYAKYNTPTGTSNNLTGFALTLLTAFNLATPAPGEVGTPSAGINSWGGVEAGGYGDGSTDNVDPKVFVTIAIFDKNYNFLDVAYQQLTSSGALMSASYKVKEAGYAFMYVSNEQQFQTDVYFDDITMSYTPSAIIQSNEYYPFGLQTANSWTRTGAVGNNFLANGGTEINNTTGVYDLDWRNYDPALGRLNQVDLMADKYGSFSPYHYSFNNPVAFNDPSGLDPIYGPGDPWDRQGGAGDLQRAMGGGGGSISRLSQLADIITNLWNSPAGGYWTDTGGTNTFSSQTAANVHYGSATTTGWYVHNEYETADGGVGVTGTIYQNHDFWNDAGADYASNGTALGFWAIPVLNYDGSDGSTKTGWDYNINVEQTASTGWINMGAELKPWLGFVYQSQAKVRGKVSASTVYGGQHLNPNTTTYLSAASLSVFGVAGSLSATIEYDQSHNVVSETQSAGLGVFGFGVQANFDNQGIKDFRIGIDDGVTFGVFGVGSLNFQMGGIYVFH